MKDRFIKFDFFVILGMLLILILFLFWFWLNVPALVPDPTQSSPIIAPTNYELIVFEI